MGRALKRKGAPVECGAFAPRWRQRRQAAALQSASLIAFLLLCFATASFAQTKRLVVVKCDGLPFDLVDRLVKQRDPQSGKSLLPWIDYIFYQRGSRLAKFYVRGISLAVTNRALLATGQQLQSKVT